MEPYCTLLQEELLSSTVTIVPFFSLASTLEEVEADLRRFSVLLTFTLAIVREPVVMTA